MLGANSCGAGPLSRVSKLNASLKHDVNHVVATNFMAAEGDATLLPRFVHLVSAVPVVKDHHAVVWLSVKFSDLLSAELDSLMVSALFTVVVLRCGKLSLEMLASNFDVFSIKEPVQVIVADGMLGDDIVCMVLQLQAHVLHDTLHVLLTDVLRSDFEARAMVKRAIQVMWAHDLVVLVHVAAIWDVPMHVLDNDRVRRANLKPVQFSAVT